MSDDDSNGDNGESEDRQARVKLRTRSADGFDDGHAEVTVEVEGGPEDDVDDVDAVAKERFDQAVDASGDTDTDGRGYE